MKFHRVYIELTNICGLKCSFCPPKTLPTHTMTLEFFESIVVQLKPYTKELAFHIVGDPLALSNLHSYLDIAYQHGFKVLLTTSGYFLDKTPQETLLHPVIKQINISLNSYNKNSMPLSFEAYMKPIIDLCNAKLATAKQLFINLRIWNLDDANSEKTFNDRLFTYLEKAFNTLLHVKTLPIEKKATLRLGEKILLHFDRYFEWPSLNHNESFDAPCQGLSSHFGILSNGVVVPCCLDKDGIIALGNLHVNSLQSILESSRVHEIRQGFSTGKAVELLCQKCLYKQRFKESSYV